MDKTGKRGAVYFRSDRAEENVAAVSEFYYLAANLTLLTNNSSTTSVEIY